MCRAQPKAGSVSGFQLTCVLSHVNAVLHWYGRMAAGQRGDEHGVRVVASVETATKALAWCSCWRGGRAMDYPSHAYFLIWKSTPA
jgi:hypothetical protein